MRSPGRRKFAPAWKGNDRDECFEWEMRGFVLSLTAALSVCACGHHRSPAEEALLRRGDCAELLRAADEARARREPSLAKDLADGCPQDRLADLASRVPPEEGLLLCGRARAADAKASCNPELVARLASSLHPRILVGPPDPSEAGDPLLLQALAELGPAFNLVWDADDPDLVVGRLSVTVDRAQSATVATVPDDKGNKQRVPATQHRVVARAEAQVELSGQTRTLRATDELRDLTWEPAPRLAVAAKFQPQIPADPEMKKRAVLAWVRALAKALASMPPEGIDVSDAKGCVAYGLSVNLTAGNPVAAANGAGDPDKVSTCEKILGEPASAGIPVP
jgi:hypothetical protein